MKKLKKDDVVRAWINGAYHDCTVLRDEGELGPIELIIDGIAVRAPREKITFLNTPPQPEIRPPEIRIGVSLTLTGIVCALLGAMLGAAAMAMAYQNSQRPVPQANTRVQSVQAAQPGKDQACADAIARTRADIGHAVNRKVRPRDAGHVHDTLADAHLKAEEGRASEAAQRAMSDAHFEFLDTIAKCGAHEEVIARVRKLVPAQWSAPEPVPVSMDEDKWVFGELDAPPLRATDR